MGWLDWFPISFGRGCDLKDRCSYYDPNIVYCKDGCVDIDLVAHCGKYRELSETR